MKRLIFSLLLLALSNIRASCDNKVVRSVVELPNVEMEHSNKSVYNEKDNRYTMVVYIDKTDCPTCFINHLYEWEIFIKECYENEIPIALLFIFSPPEADDFIFLNTLSSSSISHLSYIDVKNKFRKKNQWLINNPSKHIFIIDKEKKPIFMEAPPYNKEIMMWLRSL